MAVRNRAQNSSNDLCSNPSNMIIRAHNFKPRCRILPVPRNFCSVVVNLYCCCNCDKQLFHRELHRPVKFSDSCLSMTIVYRLSIINLLVDGLTLHSIRPPDRWANDLITWTSVMLDVSMSYRCQYLLTRHIWYWRRCDVVVFTGTQYSSSSIEVWKMGNSLQTARLTFRMLCVTVKLNLKNGTFHIWYSMTVDKTLTHILMSSLLSSALSHFSEEKWEIYFVY